MNADKADGPWRPIETLPGSGMVIVRGDDGIERRCAGGWIEGKNAPPVIPKEWRHMVEEQDD